MVREMELPLHNDEMYQGRVDKGVICKPETSSAYVAVMSDRDVRLPINANVIMLLYFYICSCRLFDDRKSGPSLRMVRISCGEDGIFVFIIEMKM